MTAQQKRKKYWLMKSEPDVYSIQDLERDGRGEWEGVRNYQARNFMRDEMRVGDMVLYYHSNSKPSGVAGIARVVREAYDDPTALDPGSKYFDPKSTPEANRWVMVDLEHVETFPEVVGLATLKDVPELKDMLVIKRGQRLSIQPVTKAEFEVVRRLGSG